MPIQDYELTPDTLRATFDPSALDFETTAQLQRELGSLGQERAIAAIDFGCGMAQPGYNIFASGPTGTGRNPTVVARVQENASRRPTPDDWCYVFNFDDARRPNVLRLPSGQGPEFAKAVVNPAMEGGLTTQDYIARYRPDMDRPGDIVSLAMAIEAQALVLYQRAAAKAQEDARAVLAQIADEERSHLQQLGKLYAGAL
jgi:hypothetical protein